MARPRKNEDSGIMSGPDTMHHSGPTLPDPEQVMTFSPTKGPDRGV